MPRRRRLFWQLFPSYLLISLIPLVAVSWYALRSQRDFYLQQTASELKAQARLVKSQAFTYLDPLDASALDELCKRIGIDAPTRVTLILPSGRVVGDSEADPSGMDNHLDRPEVSAAVREGANTSVRYSRTVQKDLMYAAVAARDNGMTRLIVRTAVPLDPLEARIRTFEYRVGMAGVLIAAVAAGLGLLVARRISKPIEAVKGWAEAISRGESRHRPPVPESAELASLSESMGRMAGELRGRMDTCLRQRNETEAVLSSMAEGVIAVDTSERVISMNQAAAEMLGCSSREARGRSIEEVLRSTALERFVRDSLADAGPVERDVTVYTEGERHLKAHGTRLLDAEGNEIGAVVVLNDVTGLRHLEKIRSEFVANISHEIKTPVTAIKGFVETLRGGAVEDPEDADRFLGIIENQAARLEAMIQDILDLSRIEQQREKGELVFSRGRVRDVLESALEACSPKAEANNIQVEVDCPASLEADIHPPLLEQAVLNLLDNALKYSSPSGRVKVEALIRGEEVLIRVLDEGQGIRKEHLPRLFERFYRVDPGRGRDSGGTGLGLAIVKHAVQAHHGTVHVESTPGKGSTFEIRFPRLRPGGLPHREIA